MSELSKLLQSTSVAANPANPAKPLAEISKISNFSKRGYPKLHVLAGPDWQEISGDPAQLKSFTELVMIEDMRHRGIVPDHYTATTNCKHCGHVPIFEGCWPESDGCPWCFNRLRGLPMPNKHGLYTKRLEHQLEALRE